MRGVPWLLVLATIALAPGATLAQQDEEPGWRMVPRIGSYGLDQHDAVHFSRHTGGLRQAAVIGLTVDFDTPVSWLGFRFSADRTIGAELTVGAETFHATTWGLSMETRLQPVPESWPVRPFAILGGGAVLLEFDGLEGIGSDSRGHAAFAYGVGVDVDLAGVPLRLEGFQRRYESGPPARSRLESRPRSTTINGHAVFTAGVRIGVR